MKGRLDKAFFGNAKVQGSATVPGIIVVVVTLLVLLAVVAMVKLL